MLVRRFGKSFNLELIASAFIPQLRGAEQILLSDKGAKGFGKIKR